MSELWRAAARVLSRRTLAVVAVVVVLLAGLGVGLTRLDFATGQDSYIEPSSRVAKDNERYQNLFGGENMVVLLTADDGRDVVDVFSPANIAQLGEIEQELLADPSVQSVVSPITLLQWTHQLVTSGVASTIIARTIEREPDADAAARRQRDAVITTLRLGAAGEQTLDNPEWVRFLVFGNDGFDLGAGDQLIAPPAEQLVVRKALRAFIPDARHAVFAAVLVGNASLDELADGSAAVEDVLEGRTFEHADATITGTPTFLTDINEYLQGGMLTLGAFAVLVMMVILLVAFRVRWRLLPLLGMAVGVVWGFGAFGFTGTDLSLVTISGLPILIGLGIEFAIQVQNRIEEQRATAPAKDPFTETLVHLGPPLLAATVAAVIAFLTMRISKVPMVQDFGVLLSIGIIALLVAGIVVPVTVIGSRERRSPTTREPTRGWVEKTVQRLGSLPRRAVLPLVAIAVVAPVVGLILEDGSKVESDPINWANQSSESIVNARLLERETGFATTLGVLIETDSAPSNGVFTDQMGAFAMDLVARAETENVQLAEASSLPTTVGWLTEVPETTALPPTGLDMLQAYEVAPERLRGLLVADGGNSTQILFQVGPSSLEQRALLLDRLHAAIDDPGTGAPLPADSSATTGGLAVVGVGLLENITANRAALTIVALLLVGAFVVLRSRDLARGLLTMVPVLLAVGLSAALVRVLGITLSPLTTISGPLVVATCAEFSVLLVARYAEQRALDQDPAASTRTAAEHTGRAFFTSALATLGGFAVLMLSTLPLLADFGTVVTINIAVALLSALVVVPPLVEEADRRHLLAMGAAPADAGRSRARGNVGWAGGAVLAVAGLVIVAVAIGGDDGLRPIPRTAAAAEAPATTSPPTTRPATTAPAVTAPGENTPEGTADTTLPPGPPERPTGLSAARSTTRSSAPGSTPEWLGVPPTTCWPPRRRPTCWRWASPACPDRPRWTRCSRPQACAVGSPPTSWPPPVAADRRRPAVVLASTS